MINLDPANETPGYDAAVDVGELVTLDGAMEETGLGPNGGLLFAADYLAANADWLWERLDPLLQKGTYLIFDTPGQSELYAAAFEGAARARLPAGKAGTRAGAEATEESSDDHDAEDAAASTGRVAERPPTSHAAVTEAGKAPLSTAMQVSDALPSASPGADAPLPSAAPAPAHPFGSGLVRVLKALSSERHVRLTAVHVVDSRLLPDVPAFIAASLLSLSTMLALELPQLNVLSKVDALGVQAAGRGRRVFDEDDEEDGGDDGAVEEQGDGTGTASAQRDASGLDEDMKALLRGEIGLGEAIRGSDDPLVARRPRAGASRYATLSLELADVVEEFGLVSFLPLAAEDGDAVAAVVAAADKANGYVWAGLAAGKDGVVPPEFEYVAGGGRVGGIWDLMLDRYVDGKPTDITAANAEGDEEEDDEDEDEW